MCARVRACVRFLLFGNPFFVGGGVEVNTDVQVFSMPYFFGKSPANVGRAVAMFAFGLMLAAYTGEGGYVKNMAKF